MTNEDEEDYEVAKVAGLQSFGKPCGQKPEVEVPGHHVLQHGAGASEAAERLQ
jgi:hypothetical protein